MLVSLSIQRTFNSTLFSFLSPKLLSFLGPRLRRIHLVLPSPPRCTKVPYSAPLFINRRASALLAPLLHLACSLTAFASPHYEVERALSLATDHKLAESPQWRTLVHCQSTNLDHCSTAISDAGFFLVKEGVDNPAAELEATIRAVLVEPTEAPLQCRFPARFEWLKEVLKEDGISFPEANCPELQEWFSAIKPHSLSIIFPSSFLNNPASAFGHTLLRIDQPNQNDQTRLIAYTANFAANTQGDNALLYAYRGVFGGYEGFFSVAPYYDKVKQYSDLEDRDIWEYELAFTPEEARRLTLHLWELRKISFLYYYFDDNCSYQLLSLLEVARPSLKLTERFGFWVLPVDTVRSVLDQAGLFTRSVFRPALASKLSHAVQYAGATQQKWALAAADLTTALDESSLLTLSEEEKIARLDLAYDALTYQTVRGKVEGEARDARAWKLLSLRSALTGKALTPALSPPTVRPDQGHGTARVSVGVGRGEGRWFTEYGIRPAFHDQLDPPQGYLQGSQIKFLETTLREEAGKGVDLHRITVLDIESLTPRNDFFAPKSWSIRLGAERRPAGGTRDPFVFSLAGGAGGSYQLLGHSLIYGLLEAEAQTSSALAPSWGVGVGPRSGLLLQLTESWRVQAEGSLMQFIAGDEHTEISLRLAQSVSLSPNNALRFTIGRTQGLHDWETRGMFEVLHYLNPVGGI